jgi:tetratricopeptide (TPR) repeat protein
MVQYLSVGEYIMREQTFDNIYTHFRASFKESPEYAIDYYTRHGSFINSIKSFNTPSNLAYFIEMSWHYINALYLKDHYNEALDEIERVLPIINEGLIRMYANDLKGEWYYGIYFLKGLASYKLRDYKTAVAVFGNLIKHDAKNDLYQKWFRYSEYGQRLRSINIVWIGSSILLLFFQFFAEFLPGKTPKIVLSAIGLAGVIWNLLYEFYARRSFRKTGDEKPKRNEP